MRTGYLEAMPDDFSDKTWDEYDWERFLQEQELRTEKYMELLEKYMDHPQRDEIIAREMGWTHLLGGESRDWEEDVDAEFEPDGTETEPASGSGKSGAMNGGEPSVLISGTSAG